MADQRTGEVVQALRQLRPENRSLLSIIHNGLIIDQETAVAAFETLTPGLDLG